jgi:hypothetical protein
MSTGKKYSGGIWKAALWTALPGLIAISLTACTPPGASSNQATVTVTATATATKTATTTATVTVTNGLTIVPASPSVSPTATATPTPSSSGVDVPAQIQKNNNGHFLIGREISGYNKVLQPDGSYVQTPIYRFVYYDFDLLSFTTNQGGIFAPRIPTFTDFDDWFVKFSTLSFLYPTPLKVNWGFVTKSGAVSDKTSMRFYTQTYFDANYYKAPANLALNNLAGDLTVSDDGVHFAEISLYENFVALIRTDNPGNILGWWIKIGGIH